MNHEPTAQTPMQPPVQELLQVVENVEIARNIFRMTLEGEMVSTMTQPGQFVHLRCGSGFAPLLRRPISIADVDLAAGRMMIIYRAEGEGTQQLATKTVGDTVDVLGPLGRGFPTDSCRKGDHALLVGGGVGVPPLYYLSKQLCRQGVEVTHVLGFQSREDAFLRDEFAMLGETHVTTMDGSMGTKGLVTDILDVWPDDSWKAVYACGPLPMLKALSARFQVQDSQDSPEEVSPQTPAASKFAEPCGKPEVYLSLEKRMGCGIGACFACVCHTPHSATDYKKVCVDGPVFKLGEVIL